MKVMKKVLSIFVLSCLMVSLVCAQAQAKVQTKLTAPETTGSVFLSVEQDTESGSGEEIEQVFTTNTGKIRCTAVAAAVGSTVAVNATSITVEPIYTGCKAFGLNATFSSNGCTYTFSLTESEAGGSAHEAGMKLACPAGKTFVIKTPIGSNCVTTIEPQTYPGDVVFLNKGSLATRDLTMEANLKGIAYVEEGSNCSKNGVTSTNLAFNARITMKGFLDSAGVKGAQTGILID